MLDEWFEMVVKPRLRGKVSLIRYADDSVICFELEDDTRRVDGGTPATDGQYGLTLHLDMTRLFRFGVRREGNGAARVRRPSTFWASRSTGRELERVDGACGARRGAGA
jgi:RNA-directed DNA polymerase